MKNGIDKKEIEEIKKMIDMALEEIGRAHV